MVMDFFAWWREQLASLIPEPLRRSLSGAGERLLLRYVEVPGGTGAIDVSLVGKHKNGTTLGRFALDDAGIDLLRLMIGRAGPRAEIFLSSPADLILRKTLTLPLAAQSDLARVVGYELDRETPFSEDEVYWSVAVTAKDRTLGQIAARLSLVPKVDIEPLIGRLRSGGIQPLGLVDDEMTDTIRIVPRTRLATTMTVTRGGMLAALCGVLALLALISPFLRQEWALARADRQIAALQPDADTALLLKRRLGGGAGDLGDPQNVIGNPLLVIAAVTEALPDDTYLTDFSQHRREVGIIGQSADAAALIQRLSDNPVLKDPGFSAPVTRDPGTGTDSFAIKLSVRQP